MTPIEEMDYFDPDKYAIDPYHLWEKQGKRREKNLKKPNEDIPANKEGYFLLPDEEFEDWCELHPCPDCNGLGVIENGETGDQKFCSHCEGSGIDPFSEYQGEDW